MLLALPAVGHAAKRKVPFGFFGTVLNPRSPSRSKSRMRRSNSSSALMARSGVESVRATFGAAGLEPAQGAYDWRRLD